MSDPGASILIGTIKGAFFLHGDAAREGYRIDGPHFLGHNVHHVVADPRDGRTIVAAVRTGHLGPTVFRSEDRGATWTEAARPPAFAKKEEGGRSVHHVFWLTPGHESEPGTWYAGVSPQGLFRSDDGGKTWEGIDGLNENPMLETWMGDIGQMTPDGGVLHSILVDPRDPARLTIGMSGGGIFESADAGANWTPRNAGVAVDFLPGDDHEYGHDPHCIQRAPSNPDRLYHQNHCGIYRLDRPDTTWVRIGDNMPKEIGDIGFAVEVHPRDPDTAWVFPMDGTDVWPRTSPTGKPAVYRTRDAGETWARQDAGFPAEQAWFTVYRQAMAVDDLDPVGVYVGTTCGEIWRSVNEGANWRSVAAHLPKVFSVETARLA